MQIEITDNSGLVKEELQAAVLRALEKCGLTAEAYAKLLCPVGKYQGGTLRESITHQVDGGGDAVYIGTNSEYGAYVIAGWNLVQGSIIQAVVKLLGFIKTATDASILHMVSALNHI